MNLYALLTPEVGPLGSKGAQWSDAIPLRFVL